MAWVFAYRGDNSQDQPALRLLFLLLPGPNPNETAADGGPSLFFAPNNSGTSQPGGRRLALTPR